MFQEEEDYESGLGKKKIWPLVIIWGEGGGGGGWRMLVVLLVFQGEDYDGDLEEKKNIFITT